MDEHLAEGYNRALRQDPNVCPNCGGTSIISVNARAFLTVSGDRECRDCSCRWSPGWGKLTAVAMLLPGLPGLAIILMGFRDAYSLFVERGEMSILRALTLSLGSLGIGIAMLSCCWFAIGVLRGRCGHPAVQECGDDVSTRKRKAISPHALLTALLTEVSEREDITPDLLVAMGKQLASGEVSQHSTPEIGFPRTTAFAPSDGELAAMALMEIGKRALRHPETRELLAIRETVALIPELAGTDRESAMDAICACGPSALKKAISLPQISSVETILVEILRTRRDHPRICRVAIRSLRSLREYSDDVIPEVALFLSKTTVEDEDGSQGGYWLLGTGDTDFYSVRAEAARLLEEAGSHALGALAHGLKSLATAPLAAEVLGRIGSASVSVLLEAFYKVPRETRLDIVDALGVIGDNSREVIAFLETAEQNETKWLARRRIKKAIRKLMA